MGALLRRLGLVGRSKARLALELSHAWLTATRSAKSRLPQRQHDGLLAMPAGGTLGQELAERIIVQTEALAEALRADPSPAAEGLGNGRREILRSERSTLLDLRREGVIADEVFERLATDLDERVDDHP